jgi:hypothetical protein
MTEAAELMDDTYRRSKVEVVVVSRLDVMVSVGHVFSTGTRSIPWVNPDEVVVMEGGLNAIRPRDRRCLFPGKPTCCLPSFE